ncbi:ribonuclease H-like domain-containing protein [Tanacetum coccineum]
MEAGTTSTTLTARLPILNPGEYDLWLMRIEQYFLMTDYSLWEVILNGNKVLKRTVRETEQEYEPTTAEEKQDRRNEMKARGTLLMALPNKDQLKFHSYKDAKLLMEALEKSTNSYSNNNTNEADNTTYGVSAAHTQSNPTSGDNLVMHGICAFLTKLLEIRKTEESENSIKLMTVGNTTENAFFAQDGIGGYDWSYKAEEEHPTNYALMAYTSSESSSSSDSEVDSCSKSFENKGVSNTVESNVVRMNNTSAPIIEDWYSDNESETDYTVRPSTKKIKYVKTVRETDAPKQNKHHPRGNQRNWNNLMSQRLGSDFKMTNKACYICGSFEHLHYVCDKKIVRPVWKNSRRVNHKNFTNKMTHPHPKRSFVPQAVLTRSGKLSTAGVAVNTVKPVNTANTKAVNTVRLVNTAASKPIANHPRTKTNAFKRGYLQSSRPFNRHFANKNSIINTNVNTARVKHTTASDRAVGNPQQKEYKEKPVIDSGCSRHMTGNKCYLDEYKDYDGGFVSFGDGKGRISRKGKIKIGSLDFDDVYFLLDESQVLLRVLRKDNIYSVDLKSVVPTGGLTCLIAKATIDESNTWHRKLGHINFKTMNKLVKGNLVKGLPSKNFENDHSCVAYFKLPTTFWAEAVNTACYVLNRVLVIKPHNKTPYELIHGRPPLIDFMKPFGYPITILNTRDHLGKFDGKADERYFVGYSMVSKAIRVFNKRTMIVKETLNIRFLENITNVKVNGPDWLFDVDSLTISMNYVPVAAGNKTNGIAETKDNIVAGQAQKEKEPEQEYILIPLCTTDPLTSQGLKDCEGYAGMKPIEVDENKASDKSGKHDQEARSESERLNKKEMQTEHTNSSNGINTVSTLVSTAGPSFDTTVPSTPVNTACYVLNRVLVIKPHNKTLYELICRRPPLIDFMKPFRCPVTILNTRDHLGKFDGKADEGYFVGYSMVSKAMRVFNKRTRIVEETLNIRFLENSPNMKGNGPDWLFDVDSLSISVNYVPVVAGNKTNGIAGTKDNIIAGQAQNEKEPEQEYILIPLCTTDPLISQGPKDCEGDAGMKPTDVNENEASDKSGKHDQEVRSESERLTQREMQTEHTNSSNGINIVSTSVSTAEPTFDTVVPSTPVNTVGPSVSTANEYKEQLFERFSPFKNAFTLPPVPNISSMDNTGIFGNAYDDEDVEEKIDMNNVISSYTVPDTSFTKFHKDHPEDQVIGSLKTPV